MYHDRKKCIPFQSNFYYQWKYLNIHRLWNIFCVVFARLTFQHSTLWINLMMWFFGEHYFTDTFLMNFLMTIFLMIFDENFFDENFWQEKFGQDLFFNHFLTIFSINFLTTIFLKRFFYTNFDENFVDQCQNLKKIYKFIQTVQTRKVQLCTKRKKMHSENR